jgi:hypothetical protein
MVVLAGRRKAWALAGVVALLILIALALPDEPQALPPPADLAGPKSAQAFVVSHGWHTGLVLPAGALNARIPAFAGGVRAPADFEVGWGGNGV